ncbi:MAG: bifunctional riboflavin kinase/FAD synthetase [bacterium]|jgi:riboflavin kinase/FMN adenylyltransferase
MKVVRGLNNWDTSVLVGSVALGYFDGVHLGHQEIIATTVAKARAQSLQSVVLSFEPHPLKVINPKAAPKLITSFNYKARLLEDLGVDIFLVLSFTPALAQTDALLFACNVLGQALGTKHVTVGYNYTFGYKGEGTPQRLASWGQDLGFAVTVIPPIAIQGESVSSSAIRQLIVQGEITRAAAFLGRWLSIYGCVSHGAGRGRSLGFPTANIMLKEGLLWPRFGVYAVRCWYLGRYLWGVANVGLVPTFGNHTARLEVNFFNFHEDLYGKKLTIELIEFLRPEQKFNHVDDLREQIEIDKEQAWRILTYYGTEINRDCPTFIYNHGAL